VCGLIIGEPASSKNGIWEHFSSFGGVLLRKKARHHSGVLPSFLFGRNSLRVRSDSCHFLEFLDFEGTDDLYVSSSFWAN